MGWSDFRGMILISQATSSSTAGTALSGSIRTTPSLLLLQDTVANNNAAIEQITKQGFLININW